MKGQDILTAVNRVFTPAAPVSESDLFAGRQSQLRAVVDTVSQPGQHVIIFGERGVGKTSLANVLGDRLPSGDGTPVLAPRINGETRDTFSSIMRKVFAEIPVQDRQRGIGFTAEDQIAIETLADRLPGEITPDLGRRMLSQLGRGATTVVIVDEFDRVSTEVSAEFADFVKGLSDYTVPATLILVGVADSVDYLMQGHESVERALVQVPMPRMSGEEIKEIVIKGFGRLEVAIEPQTVQQIQQLAQGLPHYAHLLGLHCARVFAEDDDTEQINQDVLRNAVDRALGDAQQSIRSAYTQATRSPRRENLFAQVLLACALAPSDDLGYFQPAAVREPMSALMGRQYNIPSFARHLYDFTEDERGPMLERSGTPRRYRYRFRNPLMQPYVIMRGLADGTISPEMLQSLTEAAHTP